MAHPTAFPPAVAHAASRDRGTVRRLRAFVRVGSRPAKDIRVLCLRARQRRLRWGPAHTGTRYRCQSPFVFRISDAPRRNFLPNVLTEPPLGTALPAGWSTAHATGLSVAVAGSGRDAGIPYVDIRVSGTAIAGALQLYGVFCLLAMWGNAMISIAAEIYRSLRWSPDLRGFRF